MSRFAPQMVFFGFVTIWSFATPPTIRSFFALTATTDGRIRFPRSVGTTLGILLRTEATQMLVVPRSIPMMRALSAIGPVEFWHVLYRARAVRKVGGTGEPPRGMHYGLAESAAASLAR